MSQAASEMNATHSVPVRIERLIVAGIITYATASALLWSLVRVPGLGGPDEASHLRVLFSMVNTGGLPVFEGYAPNAFAGGPVRAQVAKELTPNLFAIPVAFVIALLGNADSAVNVHVARLFNVALYPVTLWLAYLTLRRVFPDGAVERLWGVALMASVPMLTLVFAYYTNDAPMIAASTLAVYAAVRAWQSDFRTSSVLLLGAALGLVGLHKYNGFLIFPAVAGMVLWRYWRAPRRVVGLGLALLTIAAAICAWWFVRNWVLYDDAFGVAATQAAVDASGGAPTPPRARGLDPVSFARETNWVGENFATFWAGYGLVKLKLPGAAYVALSFITGIAGAGVLLWLGRAVLLKQRDKHVPLAVFAGSLFVGLWLVSFWSSYSVDVALNGRYTFPAFLPFVILMVLGLTAFAAWRSWAGALAAASIPLMLAGHLAYFVHTLIGDVVELRV